MLLSKHQVLAALRFIRGIGGHDNISARKFLDAAKQTDDVMLFYTIFRFFEQRNQRLRGNPNFTPGKGRPRVTSGNGGGGGGAFKKFRVEFRHLGHILYLTLESLYRRIRDRSASVLNGDKTGCRRGAYAVCTQYRWPE